MRLNIPHSPDAPTTGPRAPEVSGAREEKHVCSEGRVGVSVGCSPSP